MKDQVTQGSIETLFRLGVKLSGIVILTEYTCICQTIHAA